MPPLSSSLLLLFFLTRWLILIFFISTVWVLEQYGEAIFVVIALHDRVFLFPLVNIGKSFLLERTSTLPILQTKHHISDHTILNLIHNVIIVGLLCEESEHTLIKSNEMRLLLVSEGLHLHHLEVAG